MRRGGSGCAAQGLARGVWVGGRVSGAVVVTLSSVVPERVEWLWPTRLPAGKLVVVDGDPSTGKSTLTIDWAARVSTGGRWPDGAWCPCGDVLLMSAEDGLADTVAPRLVAAGADMGRVHALTEVCVVDRNDGEDEGTVRKVPPSLPRDIPLIERVVTEHGVRLVVVDVLMAFLNGSVDSHRDQDVRGVLHQLSTMADRTGCTVVLVRHLNKAGGSNALYRGGGSIGIVGAARAAYLVGRDPEDPDRRVLVCTKSNLAAEPPALAYRLQSAASGCARVEWESGAVEGITAATLLQSSEDGTPSDERDAAAMWLTDFLEKGPIRSRDVKKAAQSERIAERTLHRAREKLGVQIENQGFPRVSYWSLPPSGATGLEHKTRGTTGTGGTTGDELHVRSNPESSSSSGATQADGGSTGATVELCPECELPLPDGPGVVFDGRHAGCG